MSIQPSRVERHDPPDGAPSAPSARVLNLHPLPSRSRADEVIYVDAELVQSEAPSPPCAPPRRGLAARLAGWFIKPLANRVRTRWPSIKRTLPRDLAILAVLAIVSQFFALAYVATDSVHTTMALVIKGAHPAPGELAVFAYAGQPIEGYYADNAMTEISRHFAHVVGHEVSLTGPRKGDGFIKYLIGTPGDRIERVDRDFFLNTPRGRFFMGHAKTHTKRGVPLEASPEQVIPDGCVYVWAPHLDALDSRYAAVGLVPASAIVGKAIPLW